MIKRFRHKGLERLFTTGNASGVATQHARRIGPILAQLNVAHTPALMNGPGLNLHALKGDLKGLFGVSVTANYRIIFAFEGQDATDVDFVDDH